jgi:hypothetical protein
MSELDLVLFVLGKLGKCKSRYDGTSTRLKGAMGDPSRTTAQRPMAFQRAPFPLPRFIILEDSISSHADETQKIQCVFYLFVILFTS